MAKKQVDDDGDVYVPKPTYQKYERTASSGRHDLRWAPSADEDALKDAGWEVVQEKDDAPARATSASTTTTKA